MSTGDVFLVKDVESRMSTKPRAQSVTFTEGNSGLSMALNVESVHCDSRGTNASLKRSKPAICQGRMTHATTLIDISIRCSSADDVSASYGDK